MAWTTPLTAVANAALTAAQWNASVRDNLLMTAPALATTAGSFFATTGANSIAERIPAEAIATATVTSTSTTYGGLSGGPTVTCTTGPAALVAWGAHVTSDSVGSNTFVSYAVSGATTISAADNYVFGHAPSGAGRVVAGSTVRLQSLLTPGNNTFTTQYRVSGGTGSFANRHITVIPF